MTAKKLVVSTYLQYVPISTGSLVLLAFARRPGVAFPTFEGEA